MQFHLLLNRKPFYTSFLLLCFCCFIYQTTFGQGKVVINEFLPWSNNTCAVNGEFIELMNFGPGPINIGCYIVTNGKFSVTIPPNTVIKPGEFFVLAGSDVLPIGCGNIDSSISTQLNWTTCNCTNMPVPTTGDGFFADGGSANEKVVLFNPSLQVVDAVTRDAPPTLSNPITTSTISGACAPHVFDLDTMQVKYEALGMSTGRSNSFARTIDGDCQWVKDPPQSAHATNNRSGDVSAVQYELNITGARDCGSGGSINIQVNITDATVTDYAQMFPMNFAIALDDDMDADFDFDDTYTYGTDSMPPSIDINNLPLGRYRIVVGSALGCFLATFNLSILSCTDPLAAQILNFDLIKQSNTAYTFRWMIAETLLAQKMTLEKSRDGRNFFVHQLINPLGSGTSTYLNMVTKEWGIYYYRIKVTGKDGNVIYSQIINMGGVSSASPKAFVAPNPVETMLNVQFNTTSNAMTNYKLYNSVNKEVGSGRFFSTTGQNAKQINVLHLPTGVYQMLLQTNSSNKPIIIRFVKQ